ncbi:MAG: dihydropteroate synthase [Thermodesulfovibrionales bacterium]|nr:dihydropteroate synthase [Thermodesulfovibrionales bacterium]
MLIIAENLNTRNRSYINALRSKDRKAIADIAEKIAQKKPDYINIQCSLDGTGDEDNLPLVTEIVIKATGLKVCLDSRNLEALKKAINFCKEPPLINYLSADEKNPEEFFSLVKRSGAGLILRALRGSVPTTLEAKLMILEDLIEKANLADIPNERLYADPSVVHIGGGAGQDHVVNVRDCLIVLNEMVEPPVNTIAWIGNISTASPKNIRSRLNSAFLLYLSGAGLDSAIVDIFDEEVIKAIYLIKAFRDEIVFSPAQFGVE